jgi:3-mercaptopyruvate sulfurtransferase SseA
MVLMPQTTARPGSAGATVVTPSALPTAVGADIPRISVSDLWKRLEGGEAVVIVDTRSLESYNTQHIAGAISMPEAEVTQRAGELPANSLIVFYCT